MPFPTNFCDDVPDSINHSSGCHGTLRENEMAAKREPRQSGLDLLDLISVPSCFDRISRGSR
ncbi:MAG: hypothetical protein DMG26_03215 [Acidobacteria bacterium]|nr:MAG: hypothetical protein DMG26_03215 [Acidobacteriota bacterium]